MTDIKTVFVQVGGLCLMAQQSRPPRLFVLMPDQHEIHPGHQHHRHCAFVHVSRPFSNRDHLSPIRGRSIDLSSWPVVGGGIQSLDKLVLPVSDLVHQPVQDAFVDTHIPPSGRLGARVILPLASEFKGLGDQADIHVTLPDGTTKTEFGHGRVGVRLEIEPGHDSLTIPHTGITLKPDPRNGSIEFAVLNIRPQDLGQLPESVPKDTVLEHHAFYYDLLKPTGASLPVSKSPGRDIPGAPQRQPSDCNRAWAPFPRWGVDHPDGEKDAAGNSVKSIEPYNCTVGGGCPTGDC